MTSHSKSISAGLEDAWQSEVGAGSRGASITRWNIFGKDIVIIQDVDGHVFVNDVEVEAAAKDTGVGRAPCHVI